MNKLLTPLKLLELTYGKDVSRFNGLDIIIKEINDVSERWNEFVKENFIPKPESKERIKVLESINYLLLDVQILQDGCWKSNEEFAKSFISNLKPVIEYIEKQGNNEN